MVTAYQCIITGAAVTGGGVATMHTEDPVDQTQAQTYSDTIDAFWGAVAAACDEDVTFRMSDQASRYAAATGALQQVFTVNQGGGSTGGIAGNAVARAAQGLIRWGTDEIVNGRVLKGRTFIPGLAASSTSDAGGLNSTAAGILQAAADELIADIGGVLEVWHRPVGGAGGSVGLVTIASVWDQYAVLRSRRD